MALTDYPSTITGIALLSPSGSQVGAAVTPVFAPLGPNNNTDLAAPLTFTVPAGAQVSTYQVWTASGPDATAPLQTTTTFSGSGQFVLASTPLQVAPRITWRVGSGRHFEYAFVCPSTLQTWPAQIAPPSLLAFSVPYGQTVWRDSTGTWQQKYAPNLAVDLAGASVVYPGGRIHFLSDSARTALTAAGYAANISLTERP